jgi:Ran GTPase-activating protein (RanGAP) involved in mRNA processing and transport
MLGNLTKLNLSENRINDKGAAIISNYIIQHNKDALLSLNLEQNFLTLNGAKSILEAVRSSKSLFQILIKRNKVPPVNGPNP